MLENPFDFKKKRNAKEAVVLFLFYVGCFTIVASVFEAGAL